MNCAAIPAYNGPPRLTFTFILRNEKKYLVHAMEVILRTFDPEIQDMIGKAKSDIQRIASIVNFISLVHSDVAS